MRTLQNVEGGRGWSDEALQAVQTHLRFLQRASKEYDCGKEEGDDQVKRLRSPAQCETDMGPDLDLHSPQPLPHGWEQFLDLRTGQVYFIDWKSCRRSYMDPRKGSLKHNFNNKGSVLQHQHPHPHQLDAMWDLQSTIIEPQISECISDGCNYVSNMQLKDHMEVDSNLFTSPLLEEDWDLMELRGWMSFSSDSSHSEMSSEFNSPNNVMINDMRSEISSPRIANHERSLSSCEGESKAKLHRGVMTCHHCLSFCNVGSKEDPWCPNCGDTLS